MPKRVNYILTSIALLTYLLGIGSPLALAATSSQSNVANNGQALEIAPPVNYLTVSPGETLKTSIYIRDISSGDLLVTGQADDFVAEGENGTPKILLNSTENDPYSLKNWISLPGSLLLIPEEIKTMTIVLTVPANASPGGHYGVVRFTATPPSLASSGVSLSASIGALFLVTVTGNIQEKLSVNSFTVNNGGAAGSLFQSGPLNFVEVFKNTGNIHLQPVGQVSIFDMFGRKLASVNVNLPPANILPDSLRKFSEPLDKSVIGNKMLFGRYHADLSVTYGTSKKVLTASIVFWVIPYKLIAIIIIILIAAFFLIRYSLRRYNRHILAQAQKPKASKSSKGNHPEHKK